MRVRQAEEARRLRRLSAAAAAAAAVALCVVRGCCGGGLGSLVAEEGERALRTPVREVAVLAALEADDVLEVLEAPLGRPGTSSAVDVVLVDLRHGVLAVLAAGRHHVALLGGLLVCSTHLGRHLGAVGHLVARLLAEMACDDHLLAEFGIDITGGGKLEPRVGVGAGGALRAEAGEVVDAEDAADVPVPAGGSVSAESSVVPGTVPHLGLGVDVQERTLLVMASVKSSVEVALWHLAHIVLVQELALVALLAEAAQPVLANNRLVSADVSEGAGRPPGARRRHVELAHRRAGLVHPGEGQRERTGLIPEV